MIALERLWVTDFRSYHEQEVELSTGLNVVTGSNGEGKTSLLEAIAYLASAESFRGVPKAALIRTGADAAIVRGAGRRDDRELLAEAEIRASGPGRMQVNKQRVARRRDLLDAYRVSLFAPDDLALVKEGPALRRGYLDDLVIAIQPKLDQVRTEFERVLRQRNALLKQSHGRRTADIDSSLDVWDEKLVETGEQLAAERVETLGALTPLLAKAYGDIAGTSADLEAVYVATWREQGLAEAIDRDADLRRGSTQVGPHRDDIELVLDRLAARTHASQGEQRSLALALRLAGHQLVTDALGTPPILLLDDIFSELDPHRSEALLEHLPTGQVILTTAAALPHGAHPDRRYVVRQGRIVEGHEGEVE